MRLSEAGSGRSATGPRVVYRSYGGTNDKGRPSWFSKELSLRNLLRAAAAADSEVIFVNDGPLPEPILAIMRGAGEIVTLPGVGLFASLMAAMQIPLDRGWPDDALVYFCEDDYLHTPDALVRLREAAVALPADYLALYGALPAEREHGRGARGHVTPPGWQPVDAMVGEQKWERVLGTTSTFGVRVGALRKDLSLVKQARIPHKNMYRDWDVSLAYQGYEPHRWTKLLRDVVLLSHGDLRNRLRRAALAPFKAGMNLRAHRRPGDRHLLMAAAPNLASHLETDQMATGRDWDEVARDTQEWHRQQADQPAPSPR